MLLQKLEEVLHLEAAIFRHVSAVDSVSDSVCAELSSEGVGAQVSCNLGIVRTAQSSKRCNCVCLADLKGNNGTAREVLNDWKVFRKDVLVYTVEFLDNRSAQVEKLHR